MVGAAPVAKAFHVNCYYIIPLIPTMAAGPTRAATRCFSGSRIAAALPCHVLWLDHCGFGARTRHSMLDRPGDREGRMDTTAILNAASDLGDSAVITAISVVAAAQLAWSGYRRAALVLIVALVAAAAAIGVLKVAVIGCGAGSSVPGLNSPSGHAAMTAAVFGTLSFVMAGQISGWQRAIPPLVALLLIAGIAATRVLLGVHTIEEIAVGLATGSLVALLSIVVLRRARIVRVRLGALLLAIVVTAALTDGVRAPTEEVVHFFAAFVSHHIPLCAKAGTQAGDPRSRLARALRNGPG